ncbi:MAG: hypothetical protein JSS78_03620 [Bacteroidetes bacterium]|nr:hypothetical protein [Bacteroidota bacterium]
MRVQTYLALILCTAIIALSSACKKDQFLSSGGEVRFSTDTLNFDTVFTSLGSFTLPVKIVNPQGQRIVLQSVRLNGGNVSYFHLNINGISGNNLSNVELAAHDSIYVFATVKIDPNNDTIPFVVEDKLIATLNGNDYSIPLYAYGQNAYYLRDSVIQKNDVWKTDKPYVILHSALVDKGFTLTIPPRARVYMHADSRLYVRGQLLCGVGGSKKDTVVFQGDRLDRGYFGNKGYPGEWGGLYFDSSSIGNRIENTRIINCGNASGGGLPFAIEVFGKPSSPNQLSLVNTIIDNSFGHGILCFQANVQADNLLVTRCGAQALAILQGGNYQFNNCNFIDLSRSDEPLAAVLNYFAVDNTTSIVGDLNAQFANCVFYFSPNPTDSSYDLDKVVCAKKDAANYNVVFQNCLIENKNSIPVAQQSNNILNKHPYFENEQKLNFRLSPQSPLIGAGITTSAIKDLDDYFRMGAFDIGCYQFH